MCMCVCVYVCMCVCVYVCVYMYVCAYIKIHSGLPFSALQDQICLIKLEKLDMKNSPALPREFQDPGVLLAKPR